MPQATSAAVINALRNLFATFGIPRKVVSDNGSAFFFNEITKFYASNGVQAVTAAAYHPATNGQAERYIAELKRALLKDTTGSIQRRLARFLFRQHSTAHSATGVTPARAMFGRELPCPLDLLQPKTAMEAKESQEPLGPARRFARGERELVRQFLAKPDWVRGKILLRAGPRSWLIECAGGKVRRHLVHIRKTTQEEETSTQPAEWSVTDDLGEPDAPQPAEWSVTDDVGEPDAPQQLPATRTSQLFGRQLRSPRARRPPDRYKDFVVGGKN
uniref:Putative tick transposon n=1 Tax=Ixodes ricinus TaxID=34613 RepID=A0A147BAS0_IXORI